jgi:hypothetical protein
MPAAHVRAARLFCLPLALATGMLRVLVPGICLWLVHLNA